MGGTGLLISRMILNLFSLAPTFQLLPVCAGTEILGSQPFLLPMWNFQTKCYSQGGGRASMVLALSKGVEG